MEVARVLLEVGLNLKSSRFPSLCADHDDAQTVNYLQFAFLADVRSVLVDELPKEAPFGPDAGVLADQGQGRMAGRYGCINVCCLQLLRTQQ